MHVNPTGRFVIGGPMGDAGLTGRKIIVDTYGGMARHGGGAFSGKDPSKVDRSAAYAARWVAKNVVAAGLADRFEIELAYAIGIARPMSISIETFGTGRVADDRILGLIDRHFDLRPAAIIATLDLLPADLPPDGRLRPLRPRRTSTCRGSARTRPRCWHPRLDCRSRPRRSTWPPAADPSAATRPEPLGRARRQRHRQARAGSPAAGVRPDPRMARCTS